ncbi:HAD-IA family hydrolase [Nocardioides sp. BP30]|uniref:HAD-IA family hydrolase n=1 Tax=Nocardioides sp. BP30 TaxID=3036374 RepID=UPI002468F9D7|nr:HAD-IA family hydrolase [Nocardioides sp. BP30]WGL51431.1 HAD-IA family hydrolase [Nocardioides sp. BP30]
MQTQNMGGAEAIDAVVFDVIGTLVDEDSTWARTAQLLASQAQLASSEDLHTSWARALNERMDAVIDGTAAWQPHSRLVVEAANEALVALGGSVTAATTALVTDLDATYLAWPDVATATASLRRRRLVAGVSNGDLDCLGRLANTCAISWDVVLSTGSVQTFKPAPAAYQYAIDTLRLDPGRTLFVAAHPWDLRAAAEHGFRTAYLGRPGAEQPSSTDRFDLTLPDLAALAEQLS